MSTDADAGVDLLHAAILRRSASTVSGPPPRLGMATASGPLSAMTVTTSSSMRLRSWTSEISAYGIARMSPSASSR